MHTTLYIPYLAVIAVVCHVAKGRLREMSLAEPVAHAVPILPGYYLLDCAARSALVFVLRVMGLLWMSTVHLIIYRHVICCALRAQSLSSLLLSNALACACTRPAWEFKVFVVRGC